MDPNNLSGISIQENLDESDFSEVSTAGTDLKQILEKIQKLEAKLAQNSEAGQFGGPSMVQMGWQFGEKFGKMEKDLEGMKKKIEGMKGFVAKNAELERKIAEKEHQMQEMKAEIRKLGHENVKLNEDLAGKSRAMTEMLYEIRGLKVANEEEKTKFDGLKEEIGAKNREFEGQIVGLEEEKKKLVRELGELKEQKAEKAAVENLAGRIRELETPFKLDLLEMKENKWAADSEPKFAFSEGGLVAKHSGPNYAKNSVRAEMAIPKFNLNGNNPSIAYFEVEFLAIHPGYFTIGFCTQQFPLEGTWVGHVQNSIGIADKGIILIDGNKINLGNGGGNFQVGSVIGIGILHLPAILSMKCFVTCNGNLLGKFDLPIKFADLQLFPAVSMAYQNHSIRANFGQNEWRYHPREILQNL